MSEMLKPIDIEVPFSPQMVEEKTTLGKLTSEVMEYRSRGIFIPSVFTPMVFNATVEELNKITTDPVHSRSLIWEALKREFGIEIASATLEYVDLFNKIDKDTGLNVNSSVTEKTIVTRPGKLLIEGMDLRPETDVLTQNNQEIWSGENPSKVGGELEFDDVGDNW